MGSNFSKAVAVVTVGAVAVVFALCFPILTVAALGTVGFSIAGPIAGTLAAQWMSAIAIAEGAVSAGSLYAFLQSAAMGGAAFATIQAGAAAAAATAAVGAGIAAAAGMVLPDGGE